MEFQTVPITKTTAAARAILWWAERTPVTVTTHAVKVFTSGAETVSQAPFRIQAGQSALTVRRRNASTTAITAAMRTMLTSRAAAQAQAWKRFVELLRKNKKK